MWETIAEIPWWMYIVFLSLLNVAYRATKPHQLSMRASIFLASILIGIMIFSMLTIIHFNLYLFSLVIGSIFPGYILGWLQFRLRNIKAIKNTYQFFVPGSWSLFALLLTLLILKFYYFGYTFSVNLVALQQENHEAKIAMLCGLIIGISLGRLYYLYRCIKFGPYLQQE